MPTFTRVILLSAALLLSVASAQTPHPSQAALSKYFDPSKLVIVKAGSF